MFWLEFELLNGVAVGDWGLEASVGRLRIWLIWAALVGLLCPSEAFVEAWVRVWVTVWAAVGAAAWTVWDVAAAKALDIAETAAWGAD